MSLAAVTALVFLGGVRAPAALDGLQVMTPRGLRGRVTALFVATVTAVAFGLGPPLVGLFSDRAFGEAGIGQALATVIVGAACLGLTGALASLPVRRKRTFVARDPIRIGRSRRAPAPEGEGPA